MGLMIGRVAFREDGSLFPFFNSKLFFPNLIVLLNIYFLLRIRLGIEKISRRFFDFRINLIFGILRF